MRSLGWRIFLAASPSRPLSRAGFPGMAERASVCVSSDDASRAPSGTLSQQSVHNQASDFAKAESLSHDSPVQNSSESLRSLHIDAGDTEKPELQPSDRDQSNTSPLRKQGECTAAEAASTSKRNGVLRRLNSVVKFQLKNLCILALQRGDITKWSVDGQMDGIVNAANTRMLGGGGVDGAIHRAAGPDLYQACLKLPLVGKGMRCQTGDAVITKGFRLPVSKIVHTVGPIYDDNETSGPYLESSYKNSLRLAVSNGIKYLAFPAISCGIYGYPYDEAAEIALDTINEHSAGLKEVHFVLFEEGSWVQWLSKAHRSFEKLE